VASGNEGSSRQRLCGSARTSRFVPSRPFPSLLYMPAPFPLSLLQCLPLYRGGRQTPSRVRAECFLEFRRHKILDLCSEIVLVNRTPVPLRVLLEASSSAAPSSSTSPSTVQFRPAGHAVDLSAATLPVLAAFSVFYVPPELCCAGRLRVAPAQAVTTEGRVAAPMWPGFWQAGPAGSIALGQLEAELVSAEASGMAHAADQPCLDALVRSEYSPLQTVMTPAPPHPPLPPTKATSGRPVVFAAAAAGAAAVAAGSDNTTSPLVAPMFLALRAFYLGGAAVHAIDSSADALRCPDDTGLVEQSRRERMAGRRGGGSSAAGAPGGVGGLGGDPLMLRMLFGQRPPDAVGSSDMGETAVRGKGDAARHSASPHDADERVDIALGGGGDEAAAAGLAEARTQGGAAGIGMAVSRATTPGPAGVAEIAAIVVESPFVVFNRLPLAVSIDLWRPGSAS